MYHLQKLAFVRQHTLKSEITTTDSPAVSHEECAEWANSKVARGIGDLNLISPNTYATSNVVHPTYKWPTSASGSVYNAELVISEITYDYYHKTLHSALGFMSKCDVTAGHCITGNRVFVWTVPPKINCVPLDSLGNHSLSLHFHGAYDGHHHHPYRMEIKSLGLSIHDVGRCPGSILACYGRHTFCSQSGYIFVTDNCTGFEGLQGHKVEMSSELIESGNGENRHLISFLDEISDLMAEPSKNFTDSIAFLDCEIQRLFTTLYRLVGLTYPGQILSELTHSHVAGIAVGDLMVQISCENVTGRVLNSMKHGNEFSSRPLVAIEGMNGTSRIAQLMRDGFLYLGVRYKQAYRPGHMASFKIHDSFYLFENYTLTHIDNRIVPLIPSLKVPKFQFQPIDFSTVDRLFPLSDTNTEDINNLLITIAQNSETNALLNEYFMGHDGTSSAELGVVGERLDKVARNVFLSALTNITSPILSLAIFVLQFLSMFWGSF
ncbi:LOW QUALITY PROTEIN: uncharacterized protein LOC144750169 [Ciona intestinalis]